MTSFYIPYNKKDVTTLKKRVMFVLVLRVSSRTLSLHLRYFRLHCNHYALSRHLMAYYGI